MKEFKQLDQLIKMNKGIIRTAQALKLGISKPSFYAYIKENDLEQVAYGIYISKEAWMDTMYILHLRSQQAIFSHETALFFHDLTIQEPIKYSITVKTGYNPSQLCNDGIQVYTIKKELYELGITTATTPFGHNVPVYNMERTICDLLRSRSKIEIQILKDALKQYIKRKDKDLRTLMQYADMLHVNKILYMYLEVLL